MIPKEKLPKTNFVLDDVQTSLGCERKELVDTVKRLQDLGEGRFIVGRRGSKSRWEWKGQENAPSSNLILVSGDKPQKIAPGGSFSLRLREGPVEPIPSIAPPPEVEVEQIELPKRKYGKERDPFLVIRDLREGVNQAKEISSAEILQMIAAITGFKGTSPISFDALKDFLDNQHKELLKLREGAVWEAPPGIEHVPVEWLREWGFWDAEKREAISKELLAFRRNK